MKQNTPARSSSTQRPGRSFWTAEELEKLKRDDEQVRDAEERARAFRWAAKGKAKVVDAVHGEIVVPCGSKLAATLCAAEVWGVDWQELKDAAVMWTDEPISEEARKCY